MSEFEHLGHNAKGALRAFVSRIERLEEEKGHIAADIKEVYGEAKAMGFDTTILRRAIRERKKDKNERADQEALLELYMSALEGDLRTEFEHEDYHEDQ